MAFRHRCFWFQGRSYNQPKLSPNASWIPDAITLATVSIVGGWPESVFVDTNNTVFVAARTIQRIQIWLNHSTSPMTINASSVEGLRSLFVSTSGEIYVDNGQDQGRVNRWSFNGTQLPSVVSVCSACRGLFIDTNSNLYCSRQDHHQVILRSLNSNADSVAIVAGTGRFGNSSNTLNQPFGIFVKDNRDLYVADSANDRIQLFHAGQLNGITVAGTGAPASIRLWYPIGVVLDGNGYIFIADSYNHRIVGSGPNGFRCVAGCSGRGNGPNQLSTPWSLSFDSDGNLFVADAENHRIQKFLLSPNSYGKR